MVRPYRPLADVLGLPRGTARVQFLRPYTPASMPCATVPSVAHRCGGAGGTTSRKLAWYARGLSP